MILYEKKTLNIELFFAYQINIIISENKKKKSSFDSSLGKKLTRPLIYRWLRIIEVTMCLPTNV